LAIKRWGPVEWVLSSWPKLEVLPGRDAATVAGEFGVNPEACLAQRNTNPGLLSRGALC